MKHYKTFGQTNGSQQEYHHPQPRYTPINEVPMMDIAPPPQHRAIRNLQHQYPEQMMHQRHMQQYEMPQHEIVQPLQYEHQEERESPCAKVMQHIKSCTLCANLYKQNSNTYLCIIVFLVLLILFLVTKLIDK